MLLVEQLFLLSINPNTHRPYGRVASLLSYTLNGALLAELALEGRIELRNSKVEVVESEVEDYLLRNTINVILKETPKTPKHLISTLRINQTNIQKKVGNRLNNSGIIVIEEKRTLGIFPTPYYKFQAEHFIAEVKESFQEVLKKGKNNCAVEDAEIIILMTLVNASNLLRIIFPNGKEAREVERQIKELNQNLPISQAIKATVDSVNMSVLAAAGTFSRS